MFIFDRITFYVSNNITVCLVKIMARNMAVWCTSEIGISINLCDCDVIFGTVCLIANRKVMLECFRHG